MTAFDRIEPRLSELLDELASTPTIPDYFDALLWQAARTPQKPAWASIERWLPVVASVRMFPNRPIPVRLMIIAGLLALLAVAAVIAGIGAGPTRLPEPFGPAGNGAVFIADEAGDILSVDPASGSSRVVVGGTSVDFAPLVSRDGQRLVFLRETPTGLASWIVSTDGSGARELVPPGHDFTSADWSPTGDRIAFGEQQAIVIADVATSALTTIDVGVDVGSVAWRPGTNEVVLSTVGIDAPDATRDFYAVEATPGATPRPIALDVPAISEPFVSGDGRSITFTTWENSPANLQGRIHLIDIATGADSLITPDLNDGYHWEDARFSPDGQWVASDRYSRGGPYFVTLVATSPPYAQVRLGQAHPTGSGGSWKTFTPDGTALLVKYNNDGTTWLLPVDGSPGRQVDWAFREDQLSWQRLAR